MLVKVGAEVMLDCMPCAARAMLMRADILLLDEPTNHLDVANVAWLEQYLVSRPDVSSMIVSHDSGEHCSSALCLYTTALLHEWVMLLSVYFTTSMEG